MVQNKAGFVIKKKVQKGNISICWIFIVSDTWILQSLIIQGHILKKTDAAKIVVDCSKYSIFQKFCYISLNKRPI